MTKQEHIKFKQGMEDLAEIFNNSKPLTDKAMDIYWKHFKEYTLEEFQRSANIIIKTRKYPGFPKPAEFIEIIQGGQEEDIWDKEAKENMKKMGILE